MFVGVKIVQWLHVRLASMHCHSYLRDLAAFVSSRPVDWALVATNSGLLVRTMLGPTP